MDREEEADQEQGRANFACKIEAETIWKIDTEEIKENLVGKDEIAVRKYLSSLSEVDAAKVVFWPFWVKTIPSNKNKVKVIVKIE